VHTAYDVIGDIHGRALELEALLNLLGYEKRNGCYRHPDRQVIFLGDFIDRGDRNREVVHIARSMVDAGQALAVMGNHEYNAICYHTRHPETGEYLRPHSDKNMKQHGAFLQEFDGDAGGLDDVVGWFCQLPLYLDLGSLRAIHACWHPGELAMVDETGCRDACLEYKQFVRSADKGSPLYNAVETLLKGVEVDLPEGIVFRDKDGYSRKAVRTRWWDNKGGSYRDMALAPQKTLAVIPDVDFPADKLVGYPGDDSPVFFGHYWLTGRPEPFRKNVCCVDYSVGISGGSLCCYRWNGEAVLSADKFVTVKRY
jgi:hypothetical protein